MNETNKKSKENFKFLHTSTPLTKKSSVALTVPFLEGISCIKRRNADNLTKSSLDRFKRIKKQTKRTKKKAAKKSQDKCHENQENFYSNLSFHLNPNVLYSTPINPNLFKPKKNRQQLSNNWNFDSQYSSGALQKCRDNSLGFENDLKILRPHRYSGDLKSLKDITNFNSFESEELKSNSEEKYGVVKKLLKDKRISLSGNDNESSPNRKIASDSSIENGIISVAKLMNFEKRKVNKEIDCKDEHKGLSGKNLSEMGIINTRSSDKIKNIDSENVFEESNEGFGDKNFSEREIINTESLFGTSETKKNNEEDNLKENRRGLRRKKKFKKKTFRDKSPAKIRNINNENTFEKPIEESGCKNTPTSEKGITSTEFSFGASRTKDDCLKYKSRELSCKKFSEKEQISLKSPIKTRKINREKVFDGPGEEFCCKNTSRRKIINSELSFRTSETRSICKKNDFEENGKDKGSKNITAKSKTARKKARKSRKNLNECEIDDLSSGIYGGDLNLDSSSKMRSSKWNKKGVSQTFPVCVSVPNRHSCSEAIQSLKLALDDLCSKYIDGRQSLQRAETKERKTNVTTHDEKSSENTRTSPDAKARKNRSNACIFSDQITKNNMTNDKKNVRNTVKGSGSSKTKDLKKPNVLTSKGEILDIISDFKEAWEKSYVNGDFSIKKINSQTEKESSEDFSDFKNGTCSRTSQRDSTSKVPENSTREDTDVKSTNKSTANGFKVPKITHKKKPATKSINKKGHKVQDKRLKELTKDLNILNDSFTYPYSSTPFASPEIESKTRPSMFRGLSPVIEENTVKRISEICIEPSVLYNSHTFGKKEKAHKISKEDRLWTSTFGHQFTTSDYTCFSQFNSSSSSSEQTSRESNKSIFTSPVFRSPVTSKQGKRCRRRACKDRNLTEESSVRNKNGIYDKETNNEKSELLTEAVRNEKSNDECRKNDNEGLTELSDPFEEVLNWELCIENI